MAHLDVRLWPEADIALIGLNVRFGPEADIGDPGHKDVEASLSFFI
jgi:hypothetical protein